MEKMQLNELDLANQSCTTVESDSLKDLFGLADGQAELMTRRVCTGSVPCD